MQSLDYDQLLNVVSKNKFFVIDENLRDLYPDLAEQALKAHTFWVDQPEQAKNMNTFEQGIEFFLKRGITRSDHIFCIGGGAISDLGGFIASAVLRGVAWQVVPTTLLAMIDASIGGKVGINTAAGKNLVGAFHQPEEIYQCRKFLDTLPPQELHSGLGELLKYFFLDQKVFESWQRDEDFIVEAARFKISLTRKDIHEKGLRRVLNLGHTFGHGIESCTGIPHGLAVAHGLKLMLSIFHPDKVKLFDVIVQQLNIPLPPVPCDFQSFESYLRHDKKRIDENKLEIIIPLDIGNCSRQVISFDELIGKLKRSDCYADYFC